jgi:hypothetical protein
VRLDLPEDDPEWATTDDDLAASRAHDSERAHRFGELCLVARARARGQRPRNVCERDTKRMWGPFDRHARRDGSF